MAPIHPPSSPGAASAWIAAFGASQASRDFHPGTLKQALDGALRLGREAGRLSEAMVAVAEVERRLAVLAMAVGRDRRRDYAAGAPAPRIAVATRITSDGLVLGGWWVPGLAAAAGCVAVGVREGEPDVAVGLDHIALLAPEILVLAPGGFSPGDWHTLVSTLPENHLLRAAGLGVPRCVIDGARYVNVPGPDLARSAELLAYIAHGQRSGVTPVDGELGECNARRRA